MAGELFNAAAAGNTASQREALAALARGGTQARDAYLAGANATKADTSKLMRDVMDRATQINAPEAGAELAAKAAPGMDARAAALAGASSSNANLLGSISAANKNYFDQVAAALPIVRERALAEREARSPAKQAEANGIAGILKELGGVEMARGYAATYPGSTRHEPRTQVVGADKNFNPVAAKPGTFNFNGALAPRAPTREESAEEFAQQVGLPAGTGRALLGPAKPLAKRPTQQLADAKAQEELDARAARLALLEAARRAASSGTFFELEKAIDAGEAAQDAQAAINYVDSLDEGYLRRNSISKAALLDWIRRYGAI